MDQEKLIWTKAKFAWLPFMVSFLLLMSFSLLPYGSDTGTYVFMVIVIVLFLLSVMTSVVFTVLCFYYHKKFRNTLMHGLIGLFAIFIAVMSMVTYYKRAYCGRVRVADFPPKGPSNLDIPSKNIPEKL